jgi:hypothetical protein
MWLRSGLLIVIVFAACFLGACATSTAVLKPLPDWSNSDIKAQCSPYFVLAHKYLSDRLCLRIEYSYKNDDQVNGIELPVEQYLLRITPGLAMPKAHVPPDWDSLEEMRIIIRVSPEEYERSKECLKGIVRMD